MSFVSTVGDGIAWPSSVSCPEQNGCHRTEGAQRLPVVTVQTWDGGAVNENAYRPTSTTAQGMSWESGMNVVVE